VTRALLVHNPTASSTTDRLRDRVASLLSSDIKLEVAGTKARGHATELAADAVRDGMDAVFVLGGDGTTNEAVQALAGTDVALGVIPGGGANVFARALGLPNDGVAATRIAHRHLHDGTGRSIGLGRAGERWFTFNAGFGFDAAVVQRVEQHLHMKRGLGQVAFVLLTLRTWFSGDDVHRPSIEVTDADGAQWGPYGITIIGNADPYTFLGPRPMRVTPQASFDLGLDLVAIGRVSTTRLLQIVGQVFTRATHVDAPDVDHWHDQSSFTLASSSALPLMVDGDYTGDHTCVEVTAVPDALRVLA
jgi:diacylglycerol kinase family enzyme